MTDPRLERWLSRLLEQPGLTAIGALEDARRVHVDGSLAALEHVCRFPGPVVDVGSGGGSPGIPLAAHLPDREFVLLEANARRAGFLEDVTADFPNIRVVRGRAEEQPTDIFGVAVARALAPPPVAAEWCLPLVGPTGGAVLYVGRNIDLAAVGYVAEVLGGGMPELHLGIVVIPKIRPTPSGFPRRPGIARKRPLA